MCWVGLLRATHEGKLEFSGPSARCTRTSVDARVSLKLVSGPVMPHHTLSWVARDLQAYSAYLKPKNRTALYFARDTQRADELQR
eukprot:scaffold78449_cov72-Phaeocystis_antarctica.AAC.2